MTDNLLIFVHVIENGSFTAAAKKLGMPVTTVSGKVAALEKELQTSLLTRTTRKLGLTEAGERVFERGQRIREEVEAVTRELSAKESTPSGLLRVTAPSDFAQGSLLFKIKTFLKAHPQVKIEMLLTNRIVDLVQENVDLAIRIGDLKDSSMIAKKFFHSQGGIYATKDYLRSHSRIRGIKDLKHHSVIQYPALADKLRFSNGKESHSLNLDGRFMADEMVTLKAMTLLSEGIGLLPDHMCEAEVKEGRLIRILPDWNWVNMKVSFVYPSQKYVPLKIKAFIDWMVRV